jgi:MFS family permease
MAMAYLAVYAVQTFNLSEKYAAIYSGVMIAGGLVGNIVGAALNDRHGSKTALLFASLAWTAAMIVALIAWSWEVFLLVFILLGISSSANLVGDLSIAMDFSSGSDRPVYVGTARSMAGLFTLPTPFLAGLLIQMGGYQLMMIAALAFTLVSILVLWRNVSEPRHA